jgi:type III pantothenate kinase
MFFALDVGNTNTVIGAFDGELTGSFRISSGIKTQEEADLILCGILRKLDLSASQISAAAVSSVVPAADDVFRKSVANVFKKEAFFIRPGVKSNIYLDMPNPAELGTDRLVNCAAAFADAGGSVIVIDFGTANTYDAVVKDGLFVSGITTPGLKMRLAALSQTAMVPFIEMEFPKSPIANDTEKSVRCGAFYGILGEAEKIVEEYKKALGEDFKIYLTGGLSSVFNNSLNFNGVVDKNLTLRGIKFIYDLQGF